MTSTIRRLAYGTLLAGGALVALTLATDDPAHADTPPAAQQPGGLLGGGVQLPEQASDTAQEAVAEVAPAKPDKPAQEPADEPAPQPVEQPDEPADEPAPAPVKDEPAPTPIVEVPPVVVDPVVTDPVAVNPPPIVVTPAPAPAPTQPPAAPAAPAAAPAPLPVVIGPVPAIGVHLDGTLVPAEPPPTMVAGIEAPLCDEPAAPEERYARSLVRRILDRTTGLPKTATPPMTPAKPCGPADDNWHASTQPAVKPPAGFGLDLIAAARPTGLNPPTLALLRHIWPRSHMPTGRMEHPEPGPA